MRNFRQVAQFAAERHTCRAKAAPGAAPASVAVHSRELMSSAGTRSANRRAGRLLRGVMAAQRQQVNREPTG